MDGLDRDTLFVALTRPQMLLGVTYSYAIVNAVTVNLPDIAAVQILVNGKQVDTLAGHIDLRYPLGKALEWVRKGQ